MKQTELFFDSLFETIGNIIISFIRRVAPFAVPAAPAWFFGHAVATAVTTGSIAVFVGIVAALGLESAGILAAHHAVKFYGTGEQGRGHVAAGLAALYLIIGITAIWFLDGANRDAQVVGTAMFLIAGIVYILTGLETDSRSRDEARARAARETAETLRLQLEEREREQKRLEQKQQEQLAWEREQKRLELEAERMAKAEERRLRHEERMAQIESQHRASIEPAQPIPMPAQSQHVCQHCKRPFASVQALNAHARFCKNILATPNGHHRS